jgi:DNA-binding response OmpR family regulator
MNSAALSCSRHLQAAQYVLVRLLLVEDNPRLQLTLRKSLLEAGYAVDVAANGEDAEAMGGAAPYDVVVLDVMLPGRDGLQVCREWRNRGLRMPILMLTARDTVQDRVRGLDCGADDYLVKPFALDELLARIRALLRRDLPRKEGSLRVGDLVADSATHFVERRGRPIELTAKEYALLEYFMRHPDHILPRERLEQHVWSYDFEGTSNVVDVYVRRLRRKIDDPEPIKLLETVRGAGYRLRRTPHSLS